MNISIVFSFLNEFVYLYPMFTAIIWMVAGVIFFLRREKGKICPPHVDRYPMFSILIPCHNEENVIEKTVDYLQTQDYPDYEIIAVDDGSTDSTWAVLNTLAEKYDNLRIIKLSSNQGKAVALNMAAASAKAEFLMCLDADALLSRTALKWLAWHFVEFPRVGAVTGNPRVLNRTTLLGKIQTGEYATIIGLIKRTQRLLGKVLTVSGVVAAFRKRALLSVGFWDPDMVTEDIDITWKLERNFWDVRYEPKALCWVLVPETIRGLWRQRLRWAQGGVEVLKKNFDVWFDWRQRRIWPIYIEYMLSAIWAYSLITIILIWGFQRMGLLAFLQRVPAPIPPDWAGSILALLCLIQFLVSLLIERHYEKNILKYYFWVIWYPFCYWFISAITIVFATPKALLKPKGQRAVWKSPDRGLRQRI